MGFDNITSNIFLNGSIAEQHELWAKFIKINEYRNPNSNGKIKEDILKESIKDKIPASISMARGHILDLRGYQTKEIDIIFFDSFYNPLFQSFSKGSHINAFAETVDMIIEVKSNINKKAIEHCKQIGNDVKKVKRFFYTSVLFNFIEYASGMQYSPTWPEKELPFRDPDNEIFNIPSGLFGFRSINQKKIVECLNSINPEIDVVVSLNPSYFLLRNETKPYWDLSKIIESDHTLWLFLCWVHANLTKMIKGKHLVADFQPLKYFDPNIQKI